MIWQIQTLFSYIETRFIKPLHVSSCHCYKEILIHAKNSTCRKKYICTEYTLFYWCFIATAILTSSTQRTSNKFISIPEFLLPCAKSKRLNYSKMDFGLISIKGATFPFQKSLPSMLFIQFYLVVKSSISTFHTALINLFFKTSPANFNDIWIPTQKCRKDRDSTKLTEVH